MQKAWKRVSGYRLQPQTLSALPVGKVGAGGMGDDAREGWRRMYDSRFCLEG